LKERSRAVLPVIYKALGGAFHGGWVTGLKEPHHPILAADKPETFPHFSIRLRCYESSGDFSNNGAG